MAARRRMTRAAKIAQSEKVARDAKIAQAARLAQEAKEARKAKEAREEEVVQVPGLAQDVVEEGVVLEVGAVDADEVSDDTPALRGLAIEPDAKVPAGCEELAAAWLIGMVMQTVSEADGLRQLWTVDSPRVRHLLSYTYDYEAPTYVQTTTMSVPTTIVLINNLLDIDRSESVADYDLSADEDMTLVVEAIRSKYATGTAIPLRLLGPDMIAWMKSVTKAAHKAITAICDDESVTVDLSDSVSDKSSEVIPPVIPAVPVPAQDLSEDVDSVTESCTRIRNKARKVDKDTSDLLDDWSAPPPATISSSGGGSTGSSDGLGTLATVALVAVGAAALWYGYEYLTEGGGSDDVIVVDLDHSM